MSIFNSPCGDTQRTQTDLYEIFCASPRISTDSRRITPDSIFFALKGESFDGNDYAIAALEKGAAYSVVDRAEIVGENPQYRDRLVVVEDTLTALQDLAREHRRALAIDIVAISGSNGKTTTKELVSRVLQCRYGCYATRGNLNNHIGVPLTLLSMDHTTQIGVVEMGASSCGEIELLCSIAQPDYGILTNIGRAHLDGFGGVEGVRRGKGELLDYLVASGGVAFVANENETISEMCDERVGLKTVRYDYSLADGIPNNLEGEYNRFNIAAAVAIGRAFDIAQEQIEGAIESYQPTNNRSQRIEGRSNTIIADCYNANPSSMEVAIRNFEGELSVQGRAKVLILGDMFELGEWSCVEHQRIVELALGGDYERIILVGHNFGEVLCGDACRVERLMHFADRVRLEEHLSQEPLVGCFILIKGSRGVGLESIISLL